MTFPAGTARDSRVILAGVVAILLAACSGSGPDAGEGVARGAGEDVADASAQPTGVPEADVSGPEALAATAPEPEDPDAATADAGDGATVGGDGSEVVLMPLTAADIDGAALTGELACSFSIGNAPPLLLAKGDVASKTPSRGVVKVGDYVEDVAAPGGFDAMLEGARFSGAGKTIRIDLTGEAAGGGESPSAPATLTYDRADGARRSFAGRWQCGP